MSPSPSSFFSVMSAVFLAISPPVLAPAPSPQGEETGTEIAQMLNPSLPKTTDVKVPNATTREAVDQALRGEGLTRYESLDALKEALF